jgi:hypothetical protein
MSNLARLYRWSEIWLVDYGGGADLLLGGAERQKIWVGPPHGGRRPDPTDVFRDPGAQDVTFLVDFDVVMRAAAAAGLRVEFCGPQGELARRAGVTLGPTAREEIVRHRLLMWCLSLAGVPSIGRQRVGAIGFGDGRCTVGADVSRSLAQFMGTLPTPFRACILGLRPAGSRR